MTTDTLAPPRGFVGQFLTRTTPGYDDARRVWNRAIDRFPAAIARCTSTEDVRMALAHARSAGMPVAVRGGGHSMAGLSTCDDGLVIDLSPMRSITVDPEARTAVAGPGLLWRDFDEATQRHGLATPGGEVSDTGIAGLTLGGGIGTLSRRYGLTCDNLRAVTMVAADGRVVRASAEENGDLFWGMRGAGANFGVVTELEYALHPVGPMYAGELIHPGFRDVDALRLMTDLAPSMPDEVRLMAALVTAPHAPFVPPQAQGQPVCVLGAAHCGDPDEGERVIEPLRSLGPAAVDTVRVQSYVELQRSIDPLIPEERRSYVKSDFLGELDERALEILAEHHQRFTSPHNQILLHQLGGAIARPPEGGTAFANRDARWLLTVAAIWVDPTESPEPHHAWTREVWTAMRPWAVGTYVNHLGDEGEHRVREAYGASYDRLVALKSEWDPDDVLRLNQHIAPRTRL